MALGGIFKRVTLTFANCLFSAGVDIAGVDIKAFVNAGVLARACKSNITISATTRSAVETISFPRVAREFTTQLE
jgi:hypothetical protein